MVNVITNEQEIHKLHDLFLQKFEEFFTEEITCWVGFPGGSMEGNVRYSKELNIWVLVQKLDTRIWNGFGIGKPATNKSNSIVGEINFPYQNINRRIAGIFARENRNVLVLHRGIIGGGRKGIGKTFFIDNFRGDFVKAIDGDKETEFCLVGEINSDNFAHQVSNFINEIYRVKHSAKNEEFNNYDELKNFNYTDERSGKSVTESNEPRVINRTHGIIVSSLAETLKNKGYKVANDKNRDLFIHDGKKIKALFEIKTNSSTQSLYSAVGQLLIYSIPINNRVNLIAVLPNQLSKKVEERLNSLNIRILYYNLFKSRPKFSSIDRLIL